MSCKPVVRVRKFLIKGLGKRLVWCLFSCTWLLTGIVAAQTSAPDVELQGILAREKIERFIAWRNVGSDRLRTSRALCLPREIIGARCAFGKPHLPDTESTWRKSVLGYP